MKKILRFLLPVILLVVGIFIYVLYKNVFSSSVKKETQLNIYPNTNFDSLTQLLTENALISNPIAYKLLADKMNIKNTIHSGHYVFEKGESVYTVLKKIRGGLQTPVHLTFNNMVYKQDLASSISKQLMIDSTTLINFMQNEEALNSYGLTTENALCFFIPNTYEMYWNVSFPSFIDKMEKEHDAFWNETRIKQASAINLSPNEVYILASIVEKEYKHPDERKRIAGVYVNRLEKGMKLQADPTVKYAVGDLGLKRVLFVHTAIDNPYNTYFYSGLPPGPICLPETSTIDAVLNAEKHNYLYFCASPELDGYHVFNETLAKHNETAKLYQAALNKLSIYE